MVKQALGQMVLGLAEGVDRAFVRMNFKSARAGQRATRQSVMERLDRAATLYPEADREGRLFPPPPRRPRWKERRIGSLPQGGAIVDLRWPSHYEAIDASHAKTLARCPENATCHARWFRQRTPAPAIICLHGWGAGHYLVEEKAYRARWLYSLGVDVILATLPFHARRKPSGRWTPMFPSTNPIRTTEGFAQAVCDLRTLIRGLQVHGAPKVGVTGMSLGGYTTAVLSTVEPELAFSSPMIAFASIAQIIWEHGEGTPARRKAEEAGITLERFRAAFAAIEPLQRSPALSCGSVLIVGAKRDHVVPIHHSHQLHQHFEGSKLHTFPGSHLLQLGRNRAFEALERHLWSTGILGARRTGPS